MDNNNGKGPPDGVKVVGGTAAGALVGGSVAGIPGALVGAVIGTVGGIISTASGGGKKK